MLSIYFDEIATMVAFSVKTVLQAKSCLEVEKEVKQAIESLKNYRDLPEMEALNSQDSRLLYNRIEKAISDVKEARWTWAVAQFCEMEG